MLLIVSGDFSTIFRLAPCKLALYFGRIVVAIRSPGTLKLLKTWKGGVQDRESNEGRWRRIEWSRIAKFAAQETAERMVYKLARNREEENRGKKQSFRSHVRSRCASARGRYRCEESSRGKEREQRSRHARVLCTDATIHRVSINSGDSQVSRGRALSSGDNGRTGERDNERTERTRNARKIAREAATRVARGASRAVPSRYPWCARGQIRAPTTATGFFPKRGIDWFARPDVPSSVISIGPVLASV